MAFTINKSILSTAQLISGNITAKVIGFFVLMFFARTLSKEHLVIFPIYGMLSELSILVFSFGVFPTFVRSLPSMMIEDRTKARSMILTGSTVILAGTVFFSLFIFVFSDYIAQLILGDAESSELINIMCIGFVAVGCRRITDNILWASSRFHKTALLQIIGAFSRGSLSIGLLLIFGIKGLVLGLVLNDIFCACLALFFLRDIIIGCFSNFYSLRRLISLSLPFYLESYLMYFREYGDNWIISTFLGPAALSVYYIAKTIYLLLFVIYRSVDKVITAKLSSFRQNIEYIEQQITQLLLIISHLAAPFIFFIIGLLPTLIYFIGAGEYAASLIPCIILYIAIMIQFFKIPVGRAIFVVTSPVMRFKITLLETTILLPLLLTLTPIWGITGVAVSRFITNLAGGILQYIILRKVIRVNVPIAQMCFSLLACMSMSVFLFMCQKFHFSLYWMPIYILGGILLFLVVTSVLNGEMFYKTINRVLPLRIEDPVKFIARAIFQYRRSQ